MARSLQRPHSVGGSSRPRRHDPVLSISTPSSPSQASASSLFRVGHRAFPAAVLDPHYAWDDDRSSSSPSSPAGNTLYQKRQLIGSGRELVKPKVVEAAKGLKAAMSTASTLQLKGAIGDAKSAGVKQQKVDKAVVLLQKLETTDAVKSSMEAHDVESLRKNVMRAKRVEIDEKDLNKAQSTLEVLEAEEMLQISMRNGVTGHLKKCIDIAVFKNVDEDLISEAKALYAKSGAEWSLAKAVRSGDLDKLEAAVATATDTGVDVGDIADAQALKDELQEKKDRKAEVEKERDTGEKDEVAERLRTAIRLQETGALSKAILLAKRSDEAAKEHPEYFKGGHEKLIAEAEQLVAELEVMLHLPMAIKRQDVKKLRAVLNKAEEFNVEGDLIDQGKQLLNQLDAAEVLKQATTTKDEAKLVEALQKAREVGVERGRIVKAEQVLAALYARAELSAAIDSKEPSRIQAAITAAGLASVPRKAITEAETALAILNRPAKGRPPTSQ